MAQVTANLEKNGRGITVDYDFGGNLAEAVKKFGEEIVFANFEDAATVALQAFLRSKMKGEGEKHKSDAQIKDAISTWKPGSRKAADPAKKSETIKKQVASLPADMREALLAELRASLTSTPAAPGPKLVKGPTTKKGKAA